MSAVIDKNDKIWNIFVGYTQLIDAKATSAGIDIYGTEQKASLALGLTNAHMKDHIVCQMKKMEKQNTRQQRSKQFLSGNIDA
tara:strand:+ start:200 stop:448 length:249 start_codon:yes stop_codon:yes gene_type:complete